MADVIFDRLLVAEVRNLSQNLPLANVKISQPSEDVARNTCYRIQLRAKRLFSTTERCVVKLLLFENNSFRNNMYTIAVYINVC